MAHPLILAPGKRDGCLPFGEARGGDFALSEIPHPYRGLFPTAKVRIVFYSARNSANDARTEKQGEKQAGPHRQKHTDGCIIWQYI